MKNVFYLCLVLMSSACLPIQTPIAVGGSGNSITVGTKTYQLVWSDEFNNSGLPDPTKWKFEIGFVRNHEVQYYTANRLENCKVENGRLYITALNDSFEGHAVTSASIETKGLQDFKYGYLEVRAKMPHLGNGTWPAIWTLGVNNDEVGWPRCGEIDIMEWIGKAPTVILGSTFLPDANGNSISRNWPYIAANSQMLTDEFHNYAVEWDSLQVKYYFDNNNYATYSLSDLGSQSWMPLTKDHFLKLNLAMGGTIPPIGGGGDIDYTQFPYTFEVEYARYYK